MKPEDLGIVFVLTADQRGSRRRDDRVPTALSALAGVDVLLAFERTAGDEIQALMSSPASIVDAVEALVRDGEWRIGIGVGEIESPLPASTRAARGPAYLAAREAIEEAGKVPPGLRIVAGSDHGLHYDGLVRDAEGALWLLSQLLQRRTAAGWEVSDLMETSMTQAAIAARLGVTGAAVNQRLRAARHLEGRRGRELCTRLLQRLQEAA